jgi:hypothetical protein
MTFNQLQKLAAKHNTTVRYGEIRNANNPFFGHIALFVNNKSNGRSTHFVGFNKMHSTALYREASDWIRRNAA